MHEVTGVAFVWRWNNSVGDLHYIAPHYTSHRMTAAMDVDRSSGGISPKSGLVTTSPWWVAETVQLWIPRGATDSSCLFTRTMHWSVTLWNTGYKTHWIPNLHPLGAFVFLALHKSKFKAGEGCIMRIDYSNCVSTVRLSDNVYLSACLFVCQHRP